MIKGENPLKEHDYRQNKNLRNSVLLSTFMLLNYKALEEEYWGFRMLIKNYEACKD